MNNATALTGIQKFVPTVTTIVDATQNAMFEVTQTEAKRGRRKDHTSCAIAVSCKRKFDLDAVVVSRRMVYFVRGEIATRYVIPESVTREIVAFDRGGSFQPGTYEVKKPHGSMVLGTKRGPHPTKDKGRGPKKTSYRHITSGIRAIL